MGILLFNYNIHLLIIAGFILFTVLIGCVISTSDHLVFRRSSNKYSEVKKNKVGICSSL